MKKNTEVKSIILLALLAILMFMNFKVFADDDHIEITWQIESFFAYGAFWHEIQADIEDTGRHYDLTGSLRGSAGAASPISGTCIYSASAESDQPLQCSIRLGRESMALTLSEALNGSFVYWGSNVFAEGASGTVTLLTIN